jgi:thiol:disulfide interchange protein DsbA
MHEAIFREMHLNQKMLSTEEEILEFFARFGVAESDFQNTFRSFAVDSKLNRAKSLTQRYKIRSVPLLVVNGKFVTNGPDVKSFDDMIAVADELVDRERRRL